jgi:hypothetical protein
MMWLLRTIWRVFRFLGVTLAYTLWFLWYLITRFFTPKGIFVLFLMLGAGIAVWALRVEPQGMEGNLVAEAAGAFLSAAAINGVLLIVESARRGREEGALQSSVEHTAAGNYGVTLRNASAFDL